MTEKTEIQKPAAADPQTGPAPGRRRHPFPILTSIPSRSQQPGPVLLSEKHLAGYKEFLSSGIRATQFHPSMTASDKELALKQCCHALYDLAHILDIDLNDIFLDGNLSLSFGTQKHPGPGATYEPEQQKLLIARENSAGFLAHAWAHALDHHIWRMYGPGRISSGTFASEHPHSESLPESVRDLFHTLQFKMTTVTPQEQNHLLDTERLRSIHSATRALENQVRSLTPHILTPEQKERWNKALGNLCESRAAASLHMYSHPYFPNRMVEELSTLCKEFTGHVIPKKKRRDLNHALAFLHMAEQPCQPAHENLRRMGTTEFYKGSYALDKHFSKADQGRYSDTCEMFARAFDCYVADKLAGEKSRNQYLTAHSESYVFKEHGGESIYGIPMGNERIRINQKFDAVIRELKELGVLHDRGEQIHTSGPETVVKGNSTENNKVNLKDIYSTVATRRLAAEASPEYGKIPSSGREK